MTAKRPPVWFIFSVTIAGILANTTITPNIPDILSDLGQPDSRAGLLVAVGPAPGFFIAPILGVMADRFGRRRVLLPCLVLFAVAGLGSAVAPTFELLLAARFLQGVGSAGLINLAIVLIGDHWTGIERTKMVGRNSAVLTVCLAFLPAISGAIAEVASWRWAIGLSTFGLVVAALGTGVLPKVSPRTDRTVSEQMAGALRVIRQPLVLSVVAVGVLLFAVIFGVFLTTLPLHLENEFGLGPGERGLVLSTPAIGSTIAAFNLGRIRSRWSLRPVLVAAGAGICFACLGVAWAPAVIFILIASVFYGLGDGAAIATLQDVATSATPDSQRASVLAAWVSAVRLGQSAGPVAFAALFNATSTETAMVVGAGVFAIVTVFLAIGPITEAGIERAAASA